MSSEGPPQGRALLPFTGDHHWLGCQKMVLSRVRLPCAEVDPSPLGRFHRAKDEGTKVAILVFKCAILWP